MSVEFSPFLNILWGQNGQGKTNILESLYLLATTRSFRAANDKELVSWNELFCHVDAIVITSNRRVHIEADISTPNCRLKKLFRVNNSSITKFSKLIGFAPMVLFTPQDLEIVKGSPSLRRSFLDFILAQTSPFYLDILQRYQFALEHRNALLREKGDRTTKEDLFPWNNQIVTSGAAIIERRLSLINDLSPLIEEISMAFSSTKEKASISYNSSISFDKPISQAKLIETFFYNELEKKQKEEMSRRQTVVGPHRDDISIFLNNQPVRAFGSQGQQRSTALALKFAEWHYIKKIMEVAPVLLLDDLFSELDKNRSNAIIELIQKTGQTFITSTEVSLPQYEKINLPVSWFKIVEGGSHVLTA